MPKHFAVNNKGVVAWRPTPAEKRAGANFIALKEETWNEESAGLDKIDPYYWLRPEYFKGKKKDMAFAYGSRRYYGGRRKLRRRGRYSSSRGKKRTRIGETVGTSTCKTHIVYNSVGLDIFDTRRLEQRPLIQGINQGPGINERQRQVINLRGWKMDFELKNREEFPIYVNMAIISNKGGSAGTPVSAFDFFRYHNDDRAINFTNDLNAVEFHTLPINTDRYIVLKHKRMMLAPGSRQGEDPPPAASTWVNKSGKNYRRMRWYIKLSRQIRYDRSLGEPETGQCFLVWWCDGFGEQGGTQPVSNVLGLSERIVCYFRDPKA